MSIRTDASDLHAIAEKVVSSLASHRQIPAFSCSPGELSVADAYRLTPLLRSAFEARGEIITGRKIGFTNRRMWAAHGVQAPIWGYCTDRTTYALGTTPVQSVSCFAEPRIEPEIMFGLGKAPSPNMHEAALLECINWIALGYEIVQSIWMEIRRLGHDCGKRPPRRPPGWKPPPDLGAERCLATRTRQIQRRALLQ
jgi:2-oxo-3-hexenedioate decarboxylase